MLEPITNLSFESVKPGCSCVNDTVVHEGKCIPPDECPGEHCQQTQGCKVTGLRFFTVTISRSLANETSGCHSGLGV